MQSHGHVRRSGFRRALGRNLHPRQALGRRTGRHLQGVVGMDKTMVEVSRATKLAKRRTRPAEAPGGTLPLQPPYPPMEAELVASIPVGPEWQYEPKWDGFRCL